MPFRGLSGAAASSWAAATSSAFMQAFSSPTVACISEATAAVQPWVSGWTRLAMAIRDASSAKSTPAEVSPQ